MRSPSSRPLSTYLSGSLPSIWPSFAVCSLRKIRVRVWFPTLTSNSHLSFVVATMRHSPAAAVRGCDRGARVCIGGYAGKRSGLDAEDDARPADRDVDRPGVVERTRR